MQRVVGRAAIRAWGRTVATSAPLARPPEQEKPSDALIRQDHVFEQVPAEARNKEAFSNAIGLFLHKNVNRRGHLEFIRAALNHMEEYGVHQDLETYKRLLDIFPKGKLVADSFWQMALKHYPQHQDCCVDVLDAMEWHKVYADKETYDMVMNAFGQWAAPSLKIKRMAYWRPKMRYANCFLHHVPHTLPTADVELAKLAVRMICRDPANELSVWLTEAVADDDERTWIVSGQSFTQRAHIERHPVDKPVYVSGPFVVWVRDKPVKYLSLTADPDPAKFPTEPLDEAETVECTRVAESATANGDAADWKRWQSNYKAAYSARRRALIAAPSMHEQPDGSVLALAATGTSSRASAAVWLALLQRRCAALARLTVVFRIAEPDDSARAPPPRLSSQPHADAE